MKKQHLSLVALFGTLVLGSLLGTADAGSKPPKGTWPDTPYPQVTASTDPMVIAKGEQLVRGQAHCSQCHADYPRDKPELNTRSTPLSGGFEFAMGPMGTLYAANLTPDAETGIGSWTDAELARVIRTGVRKDGSMAWMMRFSVARMSDEDLTAVISYLRSLEPVKHEVPPEKLKALGKWFLNKSGLGPRDVKGPVGVPYAEEPSVERGEYLATNLMLCVDCHSPVDMKTFAPIPPYFSGGVVEPDTCDHSMEFASPNLTGAPEGVTGRLDEDAFVARFATGRQYTCSKMPWENYKEVPEADLRSIYRYIKAQPAVPVATGPSYRPKGSYKPPKD